MICFFAAGRDVMDRIARALEGLGPTWEGAKYVRVDGSTDAVDRRSAANSFRDDPSISVALLSITAAGESLKVFEGTEQGKVCV